MRGRNSTTETPTGHLELDHPLGPGLPGSVLGEARQPRVQIQPRGPVRTGPAAGPSTGAVARPPSSTCRSASPATEHRSRATPRRPRAGATGRMNSDSAETARGCRVSGRRVEDAHPVTPAKGPAGRVRQAPDHAIHPLSDRDQAHQVRRAPEQGAAVFGRGAVLMQVAHVSPGHQLAGPAPGRGYAPGRAPVPDGAAGPSGVQRGAGVRLAVRRHHVSYLLGRFRCHEQP